jgi:hypothetical protein
VSLDPDDCALEPGPSTAVQEDQEIVESPAFNSATPDSRQNPATEDEASTNKSEAASSSEPQQESSTECARTGPHDLDVVDGLSHGRAMPIVPSDRVLRSQATNSANNTHSYTLSGMGQVSGVLDFAVTHFVTSMPFTISSELATREEMAEAYLNEKNNWCETNAFKLVTQADLTLCANMIGSHVIYKYKPNGSLKARIVPHGHMDDEKAFLRTDAPTMSVEVMRLLISIAAERG